MKKFVVPAILLLVVLVGIGYVAASPFLALRAIQQGLEEHNADKVAHYVDFPTLRQNLKEQVGVAALAAASDTSKDAMFGNAFAALAPGFIGGLIDSYVTPSGLTQLMDQFSNQEASMNDQYMLSETQDALSKASYGFDSLSSFSVRVPHDETGEEIKFVLLRSGFDWKLSNVEFPIEQLMQNK